MLLAEVLCSEEPVESSVYLLIVCSRSTSDARDNQKYHYLYFSNFLSREKRNLRTVIKKNRVYVDTQVLETE